MNLRLAYADQSSGPWTQRRDAPERIYLATIDTTGDWNDWRASEPLEILRPGTDWEGANLPVELSHGETIDERVNQLRDPANYEQDGEIYLLYDLSSLPGTY